MAQAIVFMTWLVIKHAGRSVLWSALVESTYYVLNRLQGQAPAASGQHGIAAQLGAVHSTGSARNPLAAAADVYSSDFRFAYAR